MFQKLETLITSFIHDKAVAIDDAFSTLATINAFSPTTIISPSPMSLKADDLA